MLTVEPCVVIDLAQLMMNFDQHHALCIQKLNNRLHFTVFGCWSKSSIFNCCNEATITTQEILLVHTSCNVITLWQGRPTRGTRMLSSWHSQSHYIWMQITRNLPFPGNISSHLFHALWDMALRHCCRFGLTYLLKKNSIMNLVKSKYRSIL